MTIPGGLEVLWDDELRTEREPAKEPAKLWRNKWFAQRGWTDGRYGARWSTAVWPSREIAEQKAHEELERKFRSGAWRDVRYLGAFPEGEQPNNT